MYKIINIDIFNTDLLACFDSFRELKLTIYNVMDKGKAEQAIKDFGEPDDTTLARTSITEQGSVILWMPSLPKTTKDCGTLAHEIFHAARFILNKIGINLSDDTEEVYAYLIGYITLQIEEFVTSCESDDAP